MNIFFLYKCFKKAAQAQCDRHVVKMILEMAQLLSTAIRVYQEGLPEDERADAELEWLELYKKTHQHGQMRKWINESNANFEWGLGHGLALCEEYTYRYGKTHKTQALLERIRDSWEEVIEFERDDLTVPPAYTAEGYRPREELRQSRDHERIMEYKVQPRHASWDDLTNDYRRFYRDVKSKMEWFKYAKNRPKPEFLEEEDAPKSPKRARVDVQVE